MPAQCGANPSEIAAQPEMLEKTALVMLIVMKKNATKCNSMTPLCVFNSVWMVTELDGTEE